MCKSRPSLFVVLLVLLYIDAQAQYIPQNDSLIHLSGVVRDGNNLQPLPYAHVIVSNQGATLTDEMGYFYISLHRSDTVTITFMGYESKKLLITDSLPAKRYYTYVRLYKDTFAIEEVIVHPWPSREQFKTAFFNKRVDNKMGELAQENFDLISFEANDYNVVLGPTDPTDPKYSNRPIASLPPRYFNGALNPFGLFTWIVKVSRGDFKSKTYGDFQKVKYD